jgi:secondary thiamine-phosphate synthase enzyme
MHITAGIYVNDNESGLTEDIDQWLEQLAPFRKDYKHHDTGEDNGDSHLKALLIHHEVIVPITGGKLDLGTWRVFYAEFDGQRDKRVIVKVMGVTKEYGGSKKRLAGTMSRRRQSTRGNHSPQIDL